MIKPMKWSALQVLEATDMIEGYINQAAEPLRCAREVAGEALCIPHLPKYVERHFLGLIAEIDSIAGSEQRNYSGLLRFRIKTILESLPKGAVEAEKEQKGRAKQQSLV
jgi:hypothetical protein